MIIFHQGLPRSGKSYEACVTRIIPSLKKRRQVFAYIDGLNYDKFSEVTGIPLEELRGEVVKIPVDQISAKSCKYVIQEGNQLYSIKYKGLLFTLTEEDVPYVYDRVADDSIVLLDELQDFFPVSTKKLGDQMTTFVTRHGHRGLDIIVMGQDHRDCHNLWKRRIDQLINFTKRDAVGLPDQYTWTTYKQRDGKFVKLRSGKGNYDSKYFGLYKSHDDNVENKETFNDDRANVFKSAAFKLYVPAFVAVLVFACSYLYGFFTGGIGPTNKDLEVKTTSFHPPVLPPSSNKYVVTESVSEIPQSLVTIDRELRHETFISSLANTYKPRLSGFIWNKHKMMGYVEFLDDSFHVKERLELRQLTELGWSFKRTGYGLQLTKDDNDIIVTSWPIDAIGRVSQHTQQQL